jgi:hypothetical protein
LYWQLYKIEKMEIIKALKKEIIRHTSLFVLSGISIVLFIIFMLLQLYEIPILELDSKWIIVSSIPILIGLFIGGYIKSFKGFGIELEANLKGAIPDDLVSEITVNEDPTPGMDKESLGRLYRLTQEQRDKIKGLRFISGRGHYYEQYAIIEHYRSLRNLKFIEILDNNRNFLYVLPVGSLALTNEINSENVLRLIKAIEEGNIAPYFSNAVSDYVLKTDSMVDVYKKIKSSSQKSYLIAFDECLPVLDGNKMMIGTISKHDIEARIAKEVIEKMGK